MTDSNKHYAYFTTTGEFDPADITARVGVEPTECWRRGDVSPRTRMERKFSRWSLYTRLSQREMLEAHIRDVLSQLDANRAAFQQVSREFGACLQLVGEFYTEYPGLHLDADIVAGLAAYSLSVDFDFYYLYSDAREDT